jgi:hypothetical protein
MKLLLIITIKSFLFFGVFAIVGTGCNGLINDTNIVVNNQKLAYKSETREARNQWKPGSYLGIKLGETTKFEVIRQFGNPIWEGNPEERTFVGDTETEVLLEYEKIKDFDGRISILVGKKTNIVKAIDIYPKIPIKRSEILAKLGNDFVQVTTSDIWCNNDNFVVSLSKTFESFESSEFPILMIFANQGVYFSVEINGDVDHIGFLSKCSNMRN